MESCFFFSFFISVLGRGLVIIRQLFIFGIGSMPSDSIKFFWDDFFFVFSHIYFFFEKSDFWGFLPCFPPLFFDHRQVVVFYIRTQTDTRLAKHVRRMCPRAGVCENTDARRNRLNRVGRTVDSILQNERVPTGRKGEGGCPIYRVTITP